MVYDIVARDRASAVFARTGTAAETSAAKIGAVGKALGVFAAIDIGEHMVKAAADFQKSTNVYVTAAGETTKNLGLIRKGILEVASTTGAPIKGLTDGMYTIEKAGIRGADGLKVLKAAAQGAAEENASLGTVTNAMTSIMASYHLSANDSVSVMNQLKTAAGESKVNMEQFAGSLSTVLPIASANHVAFSDVAGALATLTQHGTSADEATQELSNTIRNLGKPLGTATKTMAQFGIDSNDVSKRLGTEGLTATLQYLSDTVIKRMGPAGQVVLSTLNNSAIAAKDAQTEFGALPPAAQKLAQSLRDGAIGVGEFRKAAKALPGEQGALALQFLTTETNAHGFQEAIRNGVQPVLTYQGAIQKMTGGANGLNTTLQITGESLAGTEERTRKIADAAKIAGKDVDGWASTQKLFSTQMAIFKDRVAALGINIGTGLLPAVTGMAKALGAGVGAIQRNSDVLGPMVKILGALVGTYYAAALAAKVYEAASVRVGAAVKGLQSAYILARAATVADYTALGTSALRYGVLAGGIVAVTSALTSFTTGAKQARDIVASLDKSFDASSPDTYGGEIDAATKKLHDMSGPAGFVKGVLGSITFGKVGGVGSNIVDTQKAVQAQLDSLTGKSSNAREAIFELGHQFNLTDQDVITLAHRMGIDLSGDIQTSINKFRALINTQEDYINLLAGTKNAQISFNEQVRNLGKNLDTNRQDWSDNTDAGENNWRTLTQATTTYAQFAAQLKAAGPLTADQTRHLNDMYGALLNTLAGLVGNRDKAADLLKQLDLFPPDVSVPVSLPGVNGAIDAASHLLGQINALRNQPPVAIHFDRILDPALGTGGGSIGPFTAPIGPGHASGGFISGPGGPRDDRILSYLSNGEFVVNANATASHRALLETINGKSGGSAGHFATGGPVTTGASASFQVNAGKPNPAQFDELFKAPVAAQKRNQAAVDKAVKAAFVDPQANALDKSRKGAEQFADTMPKDFVKRIDAQRGDVLKTQTATFFDTANSTLNRTGAAAHTFADVMPKDFAKTVTSHTGDIATSYKVAAGDPWVRTTTDMDNLADRTGKSVPARIVTGFNNAVGAVKAAADQLLALIQKPIDLLHGKTVEIVANTSITGVVTAATGGHIRGPGTSTSDSIPAMLSDGEFVVNAAATKKHLPLLHQLNKAQHFADGGLVTPEFHLSGSAGKVAASLDKMMAIATDKLSAEAQKRADAFAATFFNFSGPPGSSFQDIIAVMAKSGLPFLINSTTGGTHAPGSYHGRGMAVDFGAAGNNPGTLNRIAQYWDKYGGSLLEEIYSGGGGHFIKNGQRVGAGTYASVLAEHFSHVHIAATDAAMQRILGISGGSGGGGAAQWASVVHRVLGELGLSQALTSKVLAQIGSESGGVSGILQSVHDINSGGNEALGLLQLTPGTFNAYAGPYRALGRANPLANIFAGVNYEAHKYGGNPTLRDFGQGHGYANGGMPPIGRPFWVGERGPEQMVLGAGGATVVSSERSHRMAGGSTTLMHVENMTVASDVDFELKLKQIEFLRQTAGSF